MERFRPVPRLVCFVVIFSGFFCPVRAADPLRYTFSLAGASPPTIRVTLAMNGNASGVSRFCVQPHWGGVEHNERFIHALAATSVGNPLAVRVAEDQPSAWIVEHQPEAPLEITYELRRNEKDLLEQSGNHYEPIVRDDLFHLIGENGLLVPQWWNEDAEQDIRVEWKGFAEAGWRVTSSFDGVPAGSSIRLPLASFRHGIFIAGKLRLHDREIKGRTLRVSIFGEDWGFADERLVDLAARIVTIERDFFDDPADPFYLVSLIPAGKRQPGSWSFGGTGLTNSFACFMQPGPTLEKGDESTAMVARLLAHEYFHNWNTAKIDIEQPEQLAYWFSEGFTDFYAPRLLHRAGLIDDQQWLKWLNENLATYWASPARREKNAVIVEKFWKDRDIGILPYRRGEIVALLLDAEIRRASNGAKSLDDVMREIVGGKSGAKEKWSSARLLERFARWTSPEFVARIRAIIDNGVTPEFPSDFLSPALKLATVERYTYDLGFELDATMQKKEVTGVRQGSAAHRAGLRDGQKPVGYNIHTGNADRLVQITIAEDGGRRTIEFFPRGDGVATPQFELQGPLRF